MAIPFGGTITIYTGVPLNNKYEHTFASNTYISASASSSRTFSAQSYNRVSENKIRVEYEVGSGFNPYNATYLLIRNPSYNTNKYYCFVTDVHYVNDRTVEITFEIDVIQTWLFGGGATIRKCFIEREHQNDDTIGANIIPERLETGDYTNLLLRDISLWSHCCIAVDCGFTDSLDADGKFQPVNATPVDLASGATVQVGVHPWYFDFNGNGLGNEWTLATFIKEVGEQGKNASIYNVEIRPLVSEAVDYDVPQNTGLTGGFLNMHGGGAYTPTNNKLWTFPYNYASLINNCGQEINLRFEFFGQNAKLVLYKNSTTNTPFVIMPYSYNGMSPNNNLVLTMPIIPTVPFTTDTYSQWWAEQKAGIGWEAISNLISNIGEIKGEYFLSGGAISPIFNLMAQSDKQKLNPVSISGKFSGMDIVGSALFKFSFICKRITGEIAKTIDDYFTMFGYKQNKLDYPKYRNTRFNWHYVKTVGCNADGDCPASDLAKIATIMDNGITFWNTDKIGNYTVGD